MTLMYLIHDAEAGDPRPSPSSWRGRMHDGRSHRTPPTLNSEANED